MAAVMSGADAAWLRMDRPRNLMIVTTGLLFDRRPDWDEVERGFRTRVVERFDRFRQRAVEPVLPLDPRRPTWRDVPVSLGDHVRRVDLRHESSGRALDRHVAGRAACALDRRRPLWELDLVDLADDRGALLLRTHHALADGGALMHVVRTLTDPSGPAEAIPAPDRRRRPAPSAGGAGVARDAAALTRLGGRAFARGSTGGALTAPLAGEKEVARCDPVAVDDLRATAGAAGATVNDVYLAAVARALGGTVDGEDARRPHLDVVVPVDLRRDGTTEPDQLGNHFGLAFVRLPHRVQDPALQLAVIGEQTRIAKASPEPAVVHAALHAVSRLHPRAQHVWIDGFIKDSAAVVTNIVGPAEPVTLAGVPVAGMFLLVPSTGPIGMGVSLLSYAGSATVSVIADNATMPDVARFVDHLEVALRGHPVEER
jgi:diacylglycerol O-acyltransferase / wax synthase